MFNLRQSKTWQFPLNLLCLCVFLPRGPSRTLRSAAGICSQYWWLLTTQQSARWKSSLHPCGAAQTLCTITARAGVEVHLPQTERFKSRTLKKKIIYGDGVLWEPAIGLIWDPFISEQVWNQLKNVSLNQMNDTVNYLLTKKTDPRLLSECAGGGLNI